jgi:uncharacterized glyoxalase superfamily protein PhnB
VTDPLDVLRTGLAPIAPDPDFAARLRARLQRALALPRGVTAMTTTTPPVHAAAITPYLAVADARAAIDWYVDVFGAARAGEPYVMPDGRIGHAELTLRGARLYLADAHPEVGVVAPQPGAGTAVTLHLDVPDVDAVVDRAARASAVVEREPSDNDYGRVAALRDPFGHRWLLNGPVARPSVSGDAGYVALWVDEVERAARFYAAVLGWTYEGDGPARRTVLGTSTPMAIVGLDEARRAEWPDQVAATVFCARQVDDLAAAADRVRAAGGRAAPAHDRIVDCSDDQGLPFSLYQGPRRDAGAAPHGEIAYLTVELPDLHAAGEFYATVFGWRFTPGHVENGRQVSGPVPMTGMAGGADVPCIVALFAVDDIAAAVARVRSAGGIATEPERQPYGVTSSCTDDQGMRFYLGELG